MMAASGGLRGDWVTRLPAHSFADDLISAAVRYEPSDRQLSAKTFSKAARDTIARIELGGHVLD